MEDNKLDGTVIRRVRVLIILFGLETCLVVLILPSSQIMFSEKVSLYTWVYHI